MEHTEKLEHQQLTKCSMFDTELENQTNACAGANVEAPSEDIVVQRIRRESTRERAKESVAEAKHREAAGADNTDTR